MSTISARCTARHVGDFNEPIRIELFEDGRPMDLTGFRLELDFKRPNGVIEIGRSASVDADPALGVATFTNDVDPADRAFYDSAGQWEVQVVRLQGGADYTRRKSLVTTTLIVRDTLRGLALP